ncbi:flagellar hook protein FlgE [Herbaspirillum rubrisubalbicans]|uniref:flagellar hook protein FlgE n=1 Tax=Herbaspirillum rubrisubalbicans TaxID=80842 RepID=UPI001559589D|nr:flagellar hook protein FlgE [Herbaspirillum rubrisubalbicans]NQE49083.1 flagellar hook protein FlgE [Herbaspirillum rubrisubalbicans]
MSFQQGLSGLQGAAKHLEVVGNNVANASTVGFKQGQVQFADAYANSMNRSGNSPVGIGVTVANVSQAFTQGNIATTNNALDVAINGDGFFRLAANLNDQSPRYGRNGQFQLNKDGYLINPSMNGAYLTGYPAGAVGGDPVPLKIDTATLPATATSRVASKINLDSRKGVPTIKPFDPSNPNSYNNSTGATVYDSLGNPYSLQTYYVKSAPAGSPPSTTWSVYGSLDGKLISAAAPASGPQLLGTLRFDASGALTASTGMSLDLSTLAKGGASFPGPITLNYAGSTQTGSAFANLAQSQDGSPPGTLSSFAIGKDGSIVGSYSNQQTKVLGQVVLVNFANPNGLQPIGNNLYQASAAAGSPLVGTPTTGTFGALHGRAVEQSNVDLTAELVNMIVAQRVYQANSQSIKVQDTVLQTLVSLR